MILQTTQDTLKYAPAELYYANDLRIAFTKGVEDYLMKGPLRPMTPRNTGCRPRKGQEVCAAEDQGLRQRRKGIMKAAASPCGEAAATF